MNDGVEATIYGADCGVTPDEKDDQLLAQRVAHWERFKGPRVGDYIEFADGITHRFSHDHGEEWGIQTSPPGDRSFYMRDLLDRRLREMEDDR